VRLEDVGGIVAGTSAATEEQWDSVISHYLDIYWRWHSTYAAIGIVRYLLVRGLIYQPRLMDKRVAQNIHANGIWANSLADALATLHIEGTPLVYQR
jgi:hypothetical protein